MFYRSFALVFFNSHKFNEKIQMGLVFLKSLCATWNWWLTIFHQMGPNQLISRF